MDTAKQTMPTIRVRIQHTHTLKDGWRLAETTVEFTGEAIDYGKLVAEMRLVHSYGLEEAIRRNDIEQGS